MPRTPGGLGAAGRGLWRAITADWSLRADELRVLEVASRTADELAALEAALRGQPVEVTGPRGGRGAHPLLAEVRAHRATLLRALDQLGIDAAAARTGHERRQAGTALARARWQGRAG